MLCLGRLLGWAAKLDGLWSPLQLRVLVLLQSREGVPRLKIVLTQICIPLFHCISSVALAKLLNVSESISIASCL